ncbi:hypothetical protein ACRQ5D_34315 [Mucilaginibacter sp. P25]|uniref:hypothetical protein n=1 Tax=Mucilaginibacter sp. P25 TaxID=3423945 RepID=UPI003D7BE627
MSATILIVTGVIAVLILLYIYLAWHSSLEILKSIPVTAPQTTVAMAYYLPTASLQLKASCSVEIINTIAVDGSSAFQSARLIEITFETLVNIIPDTDFLIGLDYLPSPFMSDELKLVTGPSGLLNNINSSSDDHLAAIIGQLSDAPSKILSLKAPPAGPAAVKANLSSLIKIYENTFVVTAAELKNKHVTFDWKFRTDADTPIDASFLVKFTAAHTRGDIAAGSMNVASGIITRPLTTLSVSIDPSTPGVQGVATTDIQVPDCSRLLIVPLKRTPLVKRVNIPKFASGMLIEQDISKPSEIEAGLSIPVNILKAVFSIPSQLFNFRVQHKYQGEIAELTLQKQLQDLQKEILAGQTKGPGIHP